MSSTSTLRKTTITVTISCDVANETDKIARMKKAPRSQVMEEMLRNGLLQSKEKAIEKDFETYYLSLTDKKMKETEKSLMLSIGVI